MSHTPENYLKLSKEYEQYLEEDLALPGDNLEVERIAELDKHKKLYQQKLQGQESFQKFRKTMNLKSKIEVANLDREARNKKLENLKNQILKKFSLGKEDQKFYEQFKETYYAKIQNLLSEENGVFEDSDKLKKYTKYSRENK